MQSKAQKDYPRIPHSKITKVLSVIRDFYFTLFKLKSRLKLLS